MPDQLDKREWVTYNTISREFDLWEKPVMQAVVTLDGEWTYNQKYFEWAIAGLPETEVKLSLPDSQNSPLFVQHTWGTGIVMGLRT